ncbi:hypothetical protein BZZ01_00420 [Nostocales cyanobacterium HT-58-2]|nr:hypothetical protein BZZ01_00420 [Nostocales cyanobacterium HT-58-2]
MIGFELAKAYKATVRLLQNRCTYSDYLNMLKTTREGWVMSNSSSSPENFFLPSQIEFTVEQLVEETMANS